MTADAPMTAPNAPAPAGVVGEEEVARLLDPEVWADDLPVPTREDTIDFHRRRQASCATAREILALFAPLAQEVERLRGERERCAKIAEDYPAHQHGHLDADPHYAAQQAAHEIAAAIRAGETE